MPVAEKTYSFKAPEELGERLRVARETYISFRHDDEEADELIGRHFGHLLLDRASELEAARENQSAFMRSVLLLVVAAVETVAEEKMYAAEFAAMARERDSEDEEFARAAVATASVLWRDEE